MTFEEQKQLLEMQLKIEEEKTRRVLAESNTKSSPEPCSTISPHSFDLAKAGKFVPKFDEADPDLFFLSFERLARTLSWPVEWWTLLVQAQFVGRARRAVLALADEEASNYESVKDAVFKAYALVPDAYRRRFRSLKKRDSETYLEYARVKRESFNRWLRAKEVSSFAGLCELVLVEEFVNHVSKDVGTFIAERDVENLDQAARLADQFHLAREVTVSSQLQHRKQFGRKSYDTTSEKGQGPAEASPTAKRRNPVTKCDFCGKLGHTKPHCWKRVSFPASKEEKSKPVMLVSSPKEEEKEESALFSFSDKPCDLTNSLSAADKVTPLKEVAPTSGFNNFISEGSVATATAAVPVKVLRDTGAMQSLIREGVAPGLTTGRHVVLRGVSGRVVSPISIYQLHTEYFSGPAELAVVPDLPVDGVDIIMGNDLAGECVVGRVPPPVVSVLPVSVGDSEFSVEDCFPSPSVLVTTRAQAKASQTSSGKATSTDDDECFNISQLFQTPVPAMSDTGTGVKVVAGREALITAQRADNTLTLLFEEAEAESPGPRSNTRVYLKDRVLFRRWVPPHLNATEEGWAENHQLVVPQPYRETLIHLSHTSHFGGHVGARNTYTKLARYYYWPHMKTHVAQFVKNCHVCQLAGRPSKYIPPAPLSKVPVVPEPFSYVQVDVVGPLPRTSKGNEYIVTLVDLATRYVHGVAVRRVSAKAICNVLLGFFSLFGLPVKLQTDGASYFIGVEFQRFCTTYGITHSVSSPYHPESQGALERSHRTLKATLSKLCLEANTPQWDVNLPYALFCMRDMPHSSTGFSPFELVFGHRVRGPLSLVRDRLLDEGLVDVSVFDLVGDLRHRLFDSWRVASQNIEASQDRSKARRDLRARARVFTPGEQVLVLLPPRGDPLSAKFSGPYTVLKRISDTTYVVATPERRRAQRLCHVNTMKPYYSVCSAAASPSVCLLSEDSDLDEAVVFDRPDHASVEAWTHNPHALANIEEKLAHLSSSQKEDVVSLLASFPDVLRDRPGHTTKVVHDIVVDDSLPVKQAPYRVHPDQRAVLQKELQTMLELGLIKKGHSSWASPCFLVPKPDGTSRFVIDYRRVNSLLKKDAFPMPHINDCIESVGQATFISKFDLLKGFWQIGLTPRAQEIGAFVALGQIYLPLVMPFGLSTAPTAFQALMNDVVGHIPGTAVYIDDVLVFSDSWEEHVARLGKLFGALSDAGLVINLRKCDFGHAQVTYLGFRVGCGTLAPTDSKVKCILDLPAPGNRRAVRRFLGMIGFYRRFICNFARIAKPLTDLLKGTTKFIWSPACQEAFINLKDVLCEYPILRLPNFSRSFKLACDASQVAVGAVLFQEDDEGEDWPVAYFSRKLTPSQSRYSTVEKELLAIILSLAHFEYYASPSRPLVLRTDHKPLVYLENFKTKNAKLFRWSLHLQSFHLIFEHVKGRDNLIPDALSRPT